MFRLLRIIPILLLVVIAITFLRSIIGLVAKMFGNFVAGPSASEGGSNRPPTQVTGELHRDPVCGTYVSGATAFQRQVDSKQRFYYCSENCRAQHALVTR